FPLPSLTWWQDLKLLDNSSHVLNTTRKGHTSTEGQSRGVGEGGGRGGGGGGGGGGRGGGGGGGRGGGRGEGEGGGGEEMTTVNELVVGPLDREMVEVPFTCRSENNPLSPPIDRSVNIKIHMSPESVEVVGSGVVRAGLVERLECRAKGAYPEANITWTLDDLKLNFTGKETRQMGHDTVSWVRFVAAPKDNGAVLGCTASSNTLPDPPVNTNLTLNVTREYRRY
ncbi:hypothetical protein Pmani_038207, partial [Petrolisthes manimaculis]